MQSASGAEADRSQRAVTPCPWEGEGGRPRDALGLLLASPGGSQPEQISEQPRTGRGAKLISSSFDHGQC